MSQLGVYKDVLKCFLLHASQKSSVLLFTLLTQKRRGKESFDTGDDISSTEAFAPALAPSIVSLLYEITI